MRNTIKVECEKCREIKDDVYYREGHFRFLCNTCHEIEKQEILKSEKSDDAEI